MRGALHTRSPNEEIGRALLVLFTLVAVGCGGTIRPSGRLDRARLASSCARVPDAARMARVDDEPPEVVPGLSPEIRRVVVAARLDASTLADRTARLERFLLLQAELDAAVSEVGCLDDQLEDLQAELEQRQGEFELTLTLSSIVVGALAGIVGGVLDYVEVDARIPATVAIAGGVGSAVLGVFALLPPEHSIELVHERNVLRAVWNEERARDATLPRFVAALLDAPEEDGESPSDSLRARWAEVTEPLGEQGGALLLGDGGSYDLAALQVRELVLELLELSIRLQQQDLETLLRHLFQAGARE